MYSTGFEHLPVELILACAQFMDMFTILRFSQTCKALHYILAKPKRQAIREFAELPKPLSRGNRHLDWSWARDPPNLECAIRFNKVKALRAFLQAGINPNGLCGGFRLLSLATMSCHLEPALLLMEYGGDMSLPDQEPDRGAYRDTVFTPLLHALFRKAVTGLQIGPRLLRTGPRSAEADPICKDMIFPLMRAGAKITHMKEFKYLANMDHAFDALKYAVKHGSDLSNLTMDKDEVVQTPLHYLIRVAHCFLQHDLPTDLRMIQWFIIQYPGLLSERDSNNMTALGLSLMKGNRPEVARLLLKRGIQLGFACSLHLLNGLDELEIARLRCPEVVPFIERQLELDRLRETEVIDGLLPRDLVPWN